MSTNNFNLDNEPQNLNGYSLIGLVSENKDIPQDEMIQFIVNIIKAQGLDPQTLNMDDLRSALLNYISRIK